MNHGYRLLQLLSLGLLELGLPDLFGLWLIDFIGFGLFGHGHLKFIALLDLIGPLGLLGNGSIGLHCVYDFLSIGLIDLLGLGLLIIRFIGHVLIVHLGLKLLDLLLLCGLLCIGLIGVWAS